MLKQTAKAWFSRKFCLRKKESAHVRTRAHTHTCQKWTVGQTFLDFDVCCNVNTYNNNNAIMIILILIILIVIIITGLLSREDPQTKTNTFKAL